MEKVKRSDAERVSEALMIWEGPIPSLRHDGQRALAACFGAQAAAELLPIVSGLHDDFFASDARDRAANLQEMGDLAIADFRRQHPEITDEALQVLANHYAFAFK